METKITRSQVVDEARSWVGTPYIYQAMVKGAGVDCGLFPLALYLRFIGTPPELERLPPDWWCHTSEERYLLIVERFVKRLLITQTRREIVPGLDPGNLALTRVCESRVFNHGGIITAWPWLVHATPEGVREIDAVQDTFWANRDMAVFDISVLGVTA